MGKWHTYYSSMWFWGFESFEVVDAFAWTIYHNNVLLKTFIKKPSTVDEWYAGDTNTSWNGWVESKLEVRFTINNVFLTGWIIGDRFA